MSTDVPGTIYRLYPNPTSHKHCTAIALKDGNYLEINNPDMPGIKTKFWSLTSWCKYYGPGAIIRDEFNRVMQIVINPEHGFNLPKTEASGGIWFQWCYEMIAEAAPELFNKEVATAYNDLVEVCSKYPKLGTRTRLDIDRYSLINLWYDESDYFGKHNYYGFNIYIDFNVGYGKAYREEYMKSFNEIVPKYKILCELISPKIWPYLERMKEKIKLEKEIKVVERFIKRADLRYKKMVERHTEEVNQYKNRLEELINKYESIDKDK